MKSIAVVACPVILVLIMVGGSTGLKCYYCEAPIGCKHVSRHTAVEECTTLYNSTREMGTPLCVKTIVHGVVTRSCGKYFRDAKSGTCVEGTCSCNWDLCNGSAELSGSWWWSLGLAILTPFIALL